MANFNTSTLDDNVTDILIGQWDIDDSPGGNSWYIRLSNADANPYESTIAYGDWDYDQTADQIKFDVAYDFSDIITAGHIINKLELIYGASAALGDVVYLDDTFTHTFTYGGLFIIKDLTISFNKTVNNYA
jgi:hypothetical protein